MVLRRSLISALLSIYLPSLRHKEAVRQQINLKYYLTRNPLIGYDHGVMATTATAAALILARVSCPMCIRSVYTEIKEETGIRYTPRGPVLAHVQVVVSGTRCKFCGAILDAAKPTRF